MSKQEKMTYMAKSLKNIAEIERMIMMSGAGSNNSGANKAENSQVSENNTREITRPIVPTSFKVQRSFGNVDNGDNWEPVGILSTFCFEPLRISEEDWETTQALFWIMVLRDLHEFEQENGDIKDLVLGMWKGRSCCSDFFRERIGIR